MAEDLTRLWGNLSLNEEEVLDVNIQPEAVEGLISRGKFCLVGKLLAERFVGKDVIKRQMIRGWRPEGRVTFKVLGENLFLLEFEKEWDKSRVLEGRPWLFEKDLFSVEDFDGLCSVSEIAFEQAEFWVRMSNLPLACMGKEVGFQIGATVGEVQEVDTDEEGVGWGKYLRVRMKIDLTKPLARGRTINLLGKKTVVNFQYEKLPRYCFDCGKIFHGREGCTYQGGGKKMDAGKQYGTWLRVPSPRRREDQNRMQWRGPRMEQGESSKIQSREKTGQSAKRGTSNNGDSGDPSLSTENPIQETPANGGATSTAAEEISVSGKDYNKGKNGDQGENNGAINAQATVFPPITPDFLAEIFLLILRRIFAQERILREQ
jgi:hypothetical protein